MSMLHTITTDVLNPAVPVHVPMPVMQTSHVCVGADGSYFSRCTISDLIEVGFKPAPHATVRVRAGESMDDAAWRHTQAEARYWAGL